MIQAQKPFRIGGFIVSWDENKLVIEARREKRRELKRMIRDSELGPESDAMLYDAFEPLVCNSSLDWVNPEDCGDLTSAPMLGLFGETTTEQNGAYGNKLCGHWDGKDQYDPIDIRWGYENYQLQSPLTELLSTGKVEFRSKW